mmetsp:Transcript_38926/g.76522  ORF Transcript_38926/g.76522 Transcript_38926/m.76522 type:complete len:86 (+) Transcript_38926:421-678(+)
MAEGGPGEREGAVRAVCLGDSFLSVIPDIQQRTKKSANALHWTDATRLLCDSVCACVCVCVRLPICMLELPVSVDLFMTLERLCT